MTKISELLAAGRTVSFEFFPPKTDEAERALEKTIGELEPLEPVVRLGHLRRRRLHPRAHPRHRHPHRARRSHHRRWPTSPASPTPASSSTSPARRLPRRRHREHPRPGRRSAGRPRRRRRRPQYAPSWSSWSTRSATSPSAWRPTPSCTRGRRDRDADRRYLAAKLAAGRLRHHPVLLRGRPLLPHDRRAGRARAATTPVLPGIMPVTNAEAR